MEQNGQRMYDSYQREYNFFLKYSNKRERENYTHTERNLRFGKIIFKLEYCGKYL